MPTMGGFLNGIQSEPTKDLGLECLAQTTNDSYCSLPDESDHKKCIELDTVLSMPRKTIFSKLAVKKFDATVSSQTVVTAVSGSSGPRTNTFTYQIALTNGFDATNHPLQLANLMRIDPKITDVIEKVNYVNPVLPSFPKPAEFMGPA